MNLFNYILLGIILYLIFVVLINIFVTENIENDEFNKISLPDVIHNNFKKILSIESINKIFNIFLLYGCIRIFFLKPKYFAELLILISLLFSLRLITFTVTTLPPPYKLKKNKNLCKRKLFQNKIGYSLKKIQHTCNDLMFSGHTVHIISILLIILYFSKNLIEKVILSFSSLILLFLIISSRLHYTSDVIIAIIITFLMFNYLKSSFKMFT